MKIQSSVWHKFINVVVLGKEYFNLFMDWQNALQQKYSSETATRGTLCASANFHFESRNFFPHKGKTHIKKDWCNTIIGNGNGNWCSRVSSNLHTLGMVNKRNNINNQLQKCENDYIWLVLIWNHLLIYHWFIITKNMIDFVTVCIKHWGSAS